MDTDHVRFGLWLCSACLFAWLNRNRLNRFLLALFIVCIIVMAVRTAWVVLMVMTILIALYHLLTQKKKAVLPFLFIITGVVAVALIAYWLLPTVQQKIAYMLYDWQQYNPQTYQPTLSDATRRALNHSAWKAITNGNSNIGWAAIPTALQESFTQIHPGQTTGYGWPFNQWLFWWMGSGITGMLCFTVWMAYPVYWGLRNQNIALTVWSIAIMLSCLVETTLGYQYGVWLHAWPVALLWGNPSYKRIAI
jgi:energy-coupling factor transporter transmembrane protein EcfT